MKSNNAKHFLTLLKGEGARQHNILSGPSCGHILTYETIPISTGGLLPKLHPEVFNIINVWECIKEITQSTFSRESECVNMIFQGDTY